MTTPLPRAVAPPGSIATRAGRRDVGQSLSNVVFQGTVLRVREVPGDAAIRYSYDVRVQIGRSEDTRVTISGAVPSESHPSGTEASTGEFHPGDQVTVYRVSRSEWVITGRNPQNKESAATSLAIETERAALAMDPTGYTLSSSSPRQAHSIGGEIGGLAMASGIYPSIGVHAAMLRLSASGAVLEHITSESGRLSWMEGVLALATSGPNHERDRLSIPLLIEDSEPKRQKYRYFAVSGVPMSEGLAPGAGPNPGMLGKTAGAATDSDGATLGLEGSTALAAGHSHPAGTLMVVKHAHGVGELETIVDINEYVGRLASVTLSNHMVTDQAHLDPEQIGTVNPPVEVRSAGGARWMFAGREGQVSWSKVPSAGSNVGVVAILGGKLSRGESVLNATRAMEVRNLAGFTKIPNLEPTPFFPDLSDPERRRRMVEIEALRNQGGQVVYNDNIVLSAKGWSGLGFIEGEEDAPVFAPSLPGLTVDDASNGTQRGVSDADVTYKVLGVAVLPAPDAMENEIIAPDEEPVYRYVWSARLKPKLRFAR